MGLILASGPRWAYCTDNLPSMPSATAIGTAVTAGANNVDGSATALLSALAHDVEFLRIGVSGYSVSAGNGSTLIDILIDPAGGTNYSELIADLLGGFTAWSSNSTLSPAGVAATYDFPVWIPAGASVAARARTNNAADLTGYVLVQAFGGNARPASWWCGQRIVTLGITTASRGTTVVPGSSSAWGSWTNIGATLDTDCGALAFGVQGLIGTANMNADTMHWQIGANSTPIGPIVQKNLSSQEATWTQGAGAIFAELPAGTQLQARGKAAASSPQSLDVAIYSIS